MKVVKRGQVEALKNKRGDELQFISIGLGWHAAAAPPGGDNFDLDVSLVLLGSNQRAKKPEDLIYYKSKLALEGLIFHSGDNTYGGEDDSEDDQEVITIKNLQKIPDEYTTLRIAASVHRSKLNGYNFGMVSNAYLRVVDKAGGKQLLKYDLTGDFYDQTCVIVADIKRDRSTWSFSAVGEAVNGGFPSLLEGYGFKVKGVAA